MARDKHIRKSEERKLLAERQEKEQRLEGRRKQRKLKWWLLLGKEDENVDE